MTVPIKVGGILGENRHYSVGIRHSNQASIMGRLPQYLVSQANRQPTTDEVGGFWEEAVCRTSLFHESMCLFCRQPQAVHVIWSGGDDPKLVQTLGSNAGLSRGNELPNLFLQSRCSTRHERDQDIGIKQNPQSYHSSRVIRVGSKPWGG
jgi:hypothetical protein